MAGMTVLRIVLSYILPIFVMTGVCLGKIEFTTQPQDRVTGYNLPLLVSCTANTTFSGTIIILWKVNLTWIVDYSNKHFRQLANGSLYFERFLPADQGVYQCSAMILDAQHNHIGQIYSKNATIKLAYIHSKFKLDPDSSSGQLGASLTLQCLTPKSEPIADVYWEKDNNRVTAYEIGSLILPAEHTISSTLLIRNLSSTDTGSFRCHASNKLIPGKVVASSSATVTIAAKQQQPYFEKRPSSVIASRYRPFTWSCIIRGIPKPAVRWYKSSQLVANDSNRFMLSTGSLHIVSVQEAYNGVYTCEGSNTLGTISSNPPVAFVVAFIDYAFVKNPLNTVINTGQQLLLSCSPPRRYPTNVQITWYRDFKTLVLSSSVRVLSDGSLQVDSVTKAFEGTYFCEAHNQVTNEKRTSTKAVVTVRVSSYILPTFTNASAIIGQHLTVTCTATGSPIPTMKWYRNSQRVTQNGTLTFASIDVTDAGYYQCIAVNPAGNTTRQLHIDVYTIPNIVKSPSNKTKKVGESAEFFCAVVGIPKPVVSWYFVRRSSSTRQLVPIGTRFSQTTNSLKISAIEKADEGRYICVANSTGGQLEASASLTVHVPPIFTNIPTNKTTVQFATVTFHCSASGDPLPVVSWYDGGSLLTNGPKYEIFSGSLAVKSAVVSDSGWFTCKVSNIAGEKNTNVYLDVQVTPLIKEFSVPTQVRHGSNFTVTCRGTGNPKPLLRWRRNGTRDLVVDGTHIRGDGGRLEIIGATPKDSGLFECILTNSLGIASRNETLVVQVLPYPPKSLAANSIQSMSVTISWSPGFDGYSPTLSYVLELSRKTAVAWTRYASNIDSSKRNYTVHGLQPYTAYMFRMQTVTGIGKSIFSAILEARTLESAPSIPLNVKVNVTNATTAVLMWNKPVISHGIITLYQLQYGIIDTLQRVTKDIAANQLSSYRVALTGLIPFSRYYFQLRAATGSGESRKWGNMSSIVFANTPETVPSAAPNVLNVTAISSTSIFVSFEKLPQRFRNGILTGYSVTLTGEKLHLPISNDTEVKLVGLQKYTLYEVRVKACNRMGCGPESLPRSQRTLEDVPSQVMNVSAVAVGTSSINMTWNPPLNSNGILLGYNVAIKNSSGSLLEMITLGVSVQSLLKRQLTPNRTYHLSVAARTNAGTGPASQDIVILLGPVVIKTTSSPVSTSVKTKPTSGSSTNPTLNSTTPAKVSSARSIDWLDKKNLPILIGVSVTIIVLFVVVLILVTMACTNRLRAASDKRDRWISTRAQSGADNPAYNENRDVELTRKGTSKSPDMSGPAPSRVDIPVAEKEVNLDDFLFEEESENQAESVNPSNAYASDETIRLKGKEDKSPLVKLRDNPIDLGDDASEYDSPYTELGELGEPFSKDLFAFIDEEEKRSLSQVSSQGSLPVKEDFQSDEDSGLSQSNMETPNSMSANTDHENSHGVQVNTTDRGRTKGSDQTDHGPTKEVDLTWDPYDTSKAAAHNLEENAYDVPEIEVTKPISPDVVYAKVDKKRKRNGVTPGDDDKAELIHDSVFIYDERTDL